MFAAQRLEPTAIMALNEILLTVTLIVQLRNGGVIGSASGFFYTQSDHLYLVTNKHVVRGEKTAPDALRLRLHTGANDVSKNADYDVPVFKGRKPVWREHPTAKDADVAVVPLDLTDLQKRFIVKAWAKERLFPKDLRLDPGEHVFVIGYPLSFHDVKHNLPIFRNAMVASTYRVPFQGAQLFLTDANLHPGTSGSPVITKPKSAWVDEKGNTRIVTGTVYYLLGVHSGVVDPKVTGGVALGLGAAWYAELIDEILAGP
jgi:S1-C subfamily serine protease